MTAPRKILLAYSSRPPILDYLAAAFARRGIETRALRADENTWFDRYVIHRLNKLAHSFRILPKSRHLFEDHPLSHRNFRSSRLQAAYREFQPDLVLLVRGINFRADVLAETRPLFGWWVEHEGRVGEALKEIDRFDGYFFMNETCVRAANDHGYAKAAFLAHGVDPDAFRPLPGVAKKYDACFVGNWSPKRQQYVEAALAVTPNLALYGGKWLRKCWNRPAILKCWKGRYIEGAELNRLYNESRVVINVTNWGKGEGRARSGMNMRVLEVPATGAFLLTDESLEMDAFLTPGVHVGTYDDLADFSRQLKRHLDDAAGREAIAAAGCAHVRERHTYDHIAGEIVARYGQWLGKELPP
jgi:hypothetical protein